MDSKLELRKSVQKGVSKTGFQLMIELIYAQNLAYPKKRKYIFWIFLNGMGAESMSNLV